jgi:hypothetical protein
MWLLIVEDNPCLSEITAAILQCHDECAQPPEAITLADCSQTAILCLPEHIAGPCDGMFQHPHDSRFEAEEWDVVRQEAHWRGIHFVLFSRFARALGLARETNSPALGKPAAIEDVHPVPVPGKLPGTHPTRTSTQSVCPPLGGSIVVRNSKPLFVESATCVKFLERVPQNGLSPMWLAHGSERDARSFS